MVMRDKERRKLITNAKVQRPGARLIIRAATNTKEMTNWPPPPLHHQQAEMDLTSSRNCLKKTTHWNDHLTPSTQRQKKKKHFNTTHTGKQANVMLRISLHIPHGNSSILLPEATTRQIWKFISGKKKRKKRKKSRTSAVRCENANEVGYKGY